ncbi:unnamed protein product [Amoebophrya sp. A25]|nr:unnamed protein product [Amoebophrya sp. A25]|eukprot:GSA25T00026301001.1
MRRRRPQVYSHPWQVPAAPHHHLPRRQPHVQTSLRPWCCVVLAGRVEPEDEARAWLRASTQLGCWIIDLERLNPEAGCHGNDAPPASQPKKDKTETGNAGAGGSSSLMPPLKDKDEEGGKKDEGKADIGPPAKVRRGGKKKK